MRQAEHRHSVEQTRLCRVDARRNWLRASLLLGGTFLAYLPVARAGLIWDDGSLVINNPLIHRADGLWQFWFSTQPVDFYPVTSSMLWLEWRLWGENPTGYHLVNVLVHALDALLLWRVLRRLHIPGAWLAAALFAVHPVNVESVAWITQRKNTLAMFFYLLSLLLYLRCDRVSPPSRAGVVDAGGVQSRLINGRTRWYWLSFVAFVVSLLSKTSVASMPLVLLGLAWWRTGRVRRVDLFRSVPFFTAACIVGAISHWFQIHRAIGTDVVRTEGLGARLAGAGWATWFYLYKAVLPVGLRSIYPRWQIDGGLWWNYVPLVVLMGVLAACWRYGDGWGRGAFAGLGYFVVMLLPVSGVLDIGFMQQSLVADHWQYFAIIGPIAMVAAAISSSMSVETPGGLAALAISVALPAVLGGLTWRQCGIYVDPGIFWRTELAADEESWLAHNNLGTFLVEHGQLEEAMDHFREALEIQPTNPTVHFNLGGVLRQKGRTDEALRQFQEAVRLQPNYSMAHFNLGELLFQRGEVDEAIDHFREALQIRPGYTEAHIGLAKALSERGKEDEAIGHLQIALEARPNEVEIYNNLANLFRQKGELGEAVEHYRKALKIRPDYAIANYNLGDVLYQEGRAGEAISYYRKAVEVRPEFAPACNALGWVLATNSDPSLRDGSRAVQLAEEAERLSGGRNPRYEETVAAAYAESHQFDKAIEKAQQALRMAVVGNKAALANRLRDEIALYQTGMPYREDGRPGN